SALRPCIGNGCAPATALADRPGGLSYFSIQLIQYSFHSTLPPAGSTSMGLRPSSITALSSVNAFFPWLARALGCPEQLFVGISGFHNCNPDCGSGGCSGALMNQLPHGRRYEPSGRWLMQARLSVIISDHPSESS